MAVRKAEAIWNGDLKGGDGSLKTGSGAVAGSYSFSSRFEDGGGTNPEELLAAAHAGCFSMALAAGLGKAGFQPKRVATIAAVHLTKDDSGLSISRIDLTCEAEVPGIDAATFAGHAEATKKSCIVSRALAAVEMRLEAKLV
jgi:osmotically inducible protein OsmC